MQKSKWTSHIQSSIPVVARSTRAGGAHLFLPIPMNKIQVTSLLIERLEHIPADSVWAHRASGLRGSLLKIVESLEAGRESNPQKLEDLYDLGFHILEEAAKGKHWSPNGS